MPYKDKEKRKRYHTEYMIKYREKNRERIKEINRKSEARPERKEYLRNWWKNSPKAKEIRKRFWNSEKSKKYQRDWNENNKEKNKLKYQKYQYTKKGILNQIKKVQTRRIKFKKISGVYHNIPSKKLIEFVDNRDKKCVYCGCEFIEDPKSNRYRTYDHLDPFKPHSKENTVRCCSSCNSSKGERNVWEWLKIKGFTPSEVIYRLAKDL